MRQGMPEPAHQAADLDEVIRAHGDALERVAWGYVDNAPDREDLMQEILVALWRALPRFRGEASLRTFVLGRALARAIGGTVPALPSAAWQVEPVAIGAYEARKLDAVRPAPVTQHQPRRLIDLAPGQHDS